MAKALFKEKLRSNHLHRFSTHFDDVTGRRDVFESALNFHRILVGMGGCHGENFNYQSLPVGPF